MSKHSPPRQKTSPIKVKDYFTNPLHKIKQSAFTEVSFSVPALSTFVRHFTYKNNSKYISLADIQEYIKKFTNNNPKLIQTYVDFFIKNFKTKDNLIEVEHFVEFFIKQTKQQQLSEKMIKKIYKEMQPVNANSLLQKADYLQVPLNEEEAKKIIKMINYTYQGTGKQIMYEHFYNALTSTK